MEITVGPDGGMSFSGFSQTEALRIAVRLEEEGIAFYERVLAEFHAPAIQAGVRFLLDAERRHLALFENHLRMEEVVAGGDASQDLSVLLAPGVFPAAAELPDVFERLKAPADVLRFGLRVEEESVRFYGSLLKMTGNAGGRGVFAKVLEEERCHIDTLRGLLANV